MNIPTVIGHRGCAALAPENTLAGFRHAAALGVRCVEFDVRLCADGRLVLMHDDTLDRTTSGRGRVRDGDSGDIRRLDAGGWFSPGFTGEPVPDLQDAMALLGALGMGANIEIKAAPDLAAATGRAVAACVRRHWPTHLPPPLISSFVYDCVAAFAAAVPEPRLGYLMDWEPDAWQTRRRAYPWRSLHCNHRRLDRAAVDRLHPEGLALVAYTVNDPARARALLELGVVSVITDRPDALLAALS